MGHRASPTILKSGEFFMLKVKNRGGVTLFFTFTRSYLRGPQAIHREGPNTRKGRKYLLVIYA